MKEIKSFLKEKSQIKYHIVDEEQYDTFHEKIKKYQERHLYPHDRKFIFAVKNNEVIGLAILLDAEKDIEPLKNTLMLTNIEVKSNERNNGIASNLINIALNEVKKENKILYRTTPKEDGIKYIYDKITNKVEELNIDCIPHNLTFIYKHLENNIFSKKDITENKDKIKILYEVANNMIKENNIEKIEDINFHMTEEAEKSIENVFSGENNKVSKRKKRKPA